jgi:hypothetical protein
LIADECDSRQSSEVWNKVKGRGQRIVLITIFNKIDAGGSDTRLLELPKITIETTKKIIESYGVKDRLDTWSELAGDSPRFAHLIGFNLREYPEDILKPIDNLLERMIAGTDDPTSPVVAKRMMILMYVSLFKRFGYGASFTGEAKMLWEFIHSDDSNVSWNDFRGAIDDLRSRKLIQGDATLYISPAGLHIRLWIDWWKKYGDAFDYEQFSQIIPEGSQLIGWFYEMFQYAESTPIAQRLLDDLFGLVACLKNTNY